MAYITVVNPAILSEAGMDFGALFVATYLAAAFGSLLMGWFANYPIALAPGMSQNAFFTYSVVLPPLLVDVFDTAGILVGVATRGNLTDAEGRIPRLRSALLADSGAVQWWAPPPPPATSRAPPRWRAAAKPGRPPWWWPGYSCSS